MTIATRTAETTWEGPLASGRDRDGRRAAADGRSLAGGCARSRVGHLDRRCSGGTYCAIPVTLDWRRRYGAQCGGILRTAIAVLSLALVALGSVNCYMTTGQPHGFS